jgi:hypothetical protein
VVGRTDEIGVSATVESGGTIPASSPEPQSDVTANGHTSESACLNCGTRLIGTHCHACGQKRHVHRTLHALLHDLLHGALHFEGKIWHTLPLLVVRPGELTRRYIAGERARFVSPVALFLFMVFVMFAAFQVVGIGAPAGAEPAWQMTDSEPTEQLQNLREAREAVGEGNPAADLLDGQIANLEKRLAEQAGGGEETVTTRSGPVVYSGPTFMGQRLEEFAAQSAFVDSGIKKWRENPELFAYKLQANGYKFSWLLIPLSIPFVWMLFAWRRRFGAYDHAVFVTYSLSFMTLFFVTLTVLGAAGGAGDMLELAGILVPPWHLYRQLKGAYSLSRFSALWRTIALLALIAVILVLFVNLLLALGALG